MISPQNNEYVIELRATGLSFDNIATIAKISKPTVIKICNKHSSEINAAKSKIKEQINASLQQRKNIYQTLIEKASAELLSRDLTVASNKELVTIISQTERALSTISPQPIANNESIFSVMADDDLLAIAKAVNAT